MENEESIRDTGVQNVRGGFRTKLNAQLTKWPSRFAQPVFYGLHNDGHDDLTVKSGSGSCIRLGDRFVGVTCHHVLAAYRRDRASARMASFYFGRTRIDPEALLIDEDRKLDLVTFNLTSHVEANSHLAPADFVDPVVWPPAPLTDKDVVAFAGYPGVWRRQIAPTHFQFFHLSHGATSIESITDDHFYSTFAIDSCVGTALDGFKISQVGGMSGGPVFVWRTEPLRRAELVGFITEYQDSLDLLHVRRASCLQTDGRLRQYS